jgi:hypothetical protein
VGFGNGKFVVAFVDDESLNGADVYAATVSTGGVIGTPVRVPSVAVGSTDGPIVPAIGFGGGVFLVAYNDLDLSIGNDRDLYGRMLDGNGAPTGSNFTISSSLNDQTLPQVSFGGGSFLVLWQSQDANNPSLSALFGRQYTTAGSAVAAEAQVEPLAPTNGALMGGLYWRPSTLATDGTNFVAAWTHEAVSGTLDDTLGSRIASANIGMSPAPGLLARAPNQERIAAAANNGTVHLLVWEDARNFLTSGVDIFGLLIDSMGNNVGSAFSISNAPGDQSGPQVAARATANGSFLVTWLNQGAINAAIVTPSGGVTPVTGITSTNASDPTIAGVADGWILIWNNGGQIVEQKITSATVTGAASRIDDGTGTAVGHPSAAFDGTNVLAAWEQTNTGTHQTVTGAWLAPSGTPTGMRPVIASGAIDLDSPSVAGSAGNVAVAWHEPVANNQVIRLALLADNQPSAPTSVPAASLSGSRERPHVAMNGKGIAVAWTDHRSLSPPNQVFFVPARIVNGAISLLDNNGNGFPLFGSTTPPASLDGFVSITSDGRTLYGGTVFEVDGHGDDVERAHVRFGGIRGPGDPCDNDGGCDSGHCANSICCESACNGTCQACDSGGHCDLAPADDTRCGTTDCTGLATECVDYMPNARCEAFGVCRLPGDPAACTAMPKANGSACAAVGCTTMGGCMDGTCVCGAFQSGPSSPAVTPEFANPGCAVAGGADLRGFWLFLLVALVAVARRRIAAVVALLLISGCTDDPGGLIVQVGLTGQAAKVDHVRFILKPTSAPGFPMTATSGGEPQGVTVFATDADGDGVIDEVIDVDKAYIRGDTLSLELTPHSGGPFGVSVRAWAIDASGNRFAQTMNQSATVKPGETPILHLALACPNANCSPTAQPTPAMQPIGDPRPQAPPIAIAAGRITTGSHTADVVIGLPGSAPGMGTVVTGEVRIYVNPMTGNAMAVRLVSTGIADRFGAALATGDFHGRGTDSVIIGAPNASNGNGAIYVIDGSDWTTPPTLPANADFNGSNAEQLGTALAVADVDGDGKVDIVAGAPYGKNVYLFRDGKPVVTLHEDSIVGFGSALAASSDGILVGAPESNRVRFYHFQNNAFQVAYEWNGIAGGFGAAVALGDLDGDGRTDLIASAPAEGAGVVYVLRGADLTGTTGNVTSVHSAALQSNQMLAQLGAQLTLLGGPRGMGDSLVIAAPGTTTTNGYLLAGAAIVARPYMAIDDAAAPVAARLTFMPAENVVPLVSADVDGDGTPDLVTATSEGVEIVKGVAW